MCFSESPLNKLSKDVQINEIDQFFTQMRAFKEIRSDVSEFFSKMEKSGPEVHQIKLNTLATHISKDYMKMKFEVYIDYELTIV